MLSVSWTHLRRQIHDLRGDETSGVDTDQVSHARTSTRLPARQRLDPLLTVARRCRRGPSPPPSGRSGRSRTRCTGSSMRPSARTGRGRGATTPPRTSTSCGARRRPCCRRSPTAFPSADVIGAARAGNISRRYSPPGQSSAPFSPSSKALGRPGSENIRRR